MNSVEYLGNFGAFPPPPLLLRNLNEDYFIIIIITYKLISIQSLLRLLFIKYYSTFTVIAYSLFGHEVKKKTSSGVKYKTPGKVVWILNYSERNIGGGGVSQTLQRSRTYTLLQGLSNNDIRGSYLISSWLSLCRTIQV